MLANNIKAPDFSLKDYEGKIHKLSDYKGKKIILYFYPKDDTPGCTKEACGFRDSFSDFKKKNVIIIGISKDDEKSHAKFIKKYDLPFVLLSDHEHKVIDAYGAWGERSFMGKKYFGTIRSTYIIDEKGFIIKSFPDVNPENHSKELLEAL